MPLLAQCRATHVLENPIIIAVNGHLSDMSSDSSRTGLFHLTSLCMRIPTVPVALRRPIDNVAKGRHAPSQTVVSHKTAQLLQRFR